jgi:ssRNA-specific RNase YbeY (16S rRNA maturation enzyme)
MRACKRTLFGKDAVTDVISLAYDPVPGEADGRTADVYINTERAAQESAARERPARRAAGGITAEFALYLAHGIDHLTGGRDETPAGRRGMRRRELRWLNLARRQGLMDGPP